MPVGRAATRRRPRILASGAAWAQEIAPGLAAALGVALAARFVARMLPAAISEVAIGLLLGLLVSNVLPLPRAVNAGVRLASQQILRLGIVLLGARLLLGEVASVGLGVLGLVVVCMGAALSFSLLMGRALGLPPRLALLIGVGTAVCGNSAIVATAPVVRAEEREVSFAVATITIFGTLAVFVYPLIGRTLELPDAIFGVWAGVAVNDTSQVVAAGAAYSPAARDLATVVKLLRNTLMGPLLLLIAWWWAPGDTASEGGAARRGARRAFPLFVLGFLALALARTLGVVDATAATSIDVAARLCILVALAGVGLSTRVAQLRAVGVAPLCLGFGTAALLAALSLVLIVALGIGPSIAPLP